jgi:hypothetical protein
VPALGGVGARAFAFLRREAIPISPASDAQPALAQLARPPSLDAASASGPPAPQSGRKLSISLTLPAATSRDLADGPALEGSSGATQPALAVHARSRSASTAFAMAAASPTLAARCVRGARRLCSLVFFLFLFLLFLLFFFSSFFAC